MFYFRYSDDELCNEPESLIKMFVAALVLLFLIRLKFPRGTPISNIFIDGTYWNMEHMEPMEPWQLMEPHETPILKHGTLNTFLIFQNKTVGLKNEHE